MKILYEPSRLWETLGGIALVAAAVCMACGAPICKAAKNNLGKNVLAVIGSAAFAAHYNGDIRIKSVSAARRIYCAAETAEQPYSCRRPKNGL